MAFKRLFSFLIIAVASGAISPAFAADAPPNAAAPAAAPSSDRAPDPALQDRVVALVQDRRCGDAIKEARKGGDENLALQVADMCGIKPSSIGSFQASGGAKSGGDGGGSAAAAGGGRH